MNMEGILLTVVSFLQMLALNELHLLLDLSKNATMAQKTYRYVQKLA